MRARTLAAMPVSALSAEFPEGFHQALGLSYVEARLRDPLAVVPRTLAE